MPAVPLRARGEDSFSAHQIALSTPEQKCIGWPEQKYISEAGKKAPRTGGPWFRHQAWIGLSAGVSELAGRGRRLL